MDGRGKIFTGKLGEEAAIGFLQRNGYKILENNFRTPFGEIDVVAENKEFVVFIEVKSRAGSSLGPPYISVTRNKARHIVKNAFCYLKRRGLTNSFWRIDVVSVKLNPFHQVENIELIENAIQEEDL